MLTNSSNFMPVFVREACGSSTFYLPSLESWTSFLKASVFFSSRGPNRMNQSIKFRAYSRLLSALVSVKPFRGKVRKMYVRVRGYDISVMRCATAFFHVTHISTSLELAKSIGLRFEVLFLPFIRDVPPMRS